MAKKILLIQFREGVGAEHEIKCFRIKSGLKGGQLRVFNAWKNPLNNEIVKDYDGLLIGGSAEACVSKRDYPRPKQAERFIQYCWQENIPIFASCFGMHLVGQALGGKVICDFHNREVGTYKIYLNKKGKEDQIFKKMPDSFDAQEGHKDRLVKLPPGAINLAYSNKCQIQAITWPGKKIYALQFHAELNDAKVNWRIRYFKDLYLEQRSELRRVLNNTKPSPSTGRLIRDWLQTI